MPETKGPIYIPGVKGFSSVEEGIEFAEQEKRREFGGATLITPVVEDQTIASAGLGLGLLVERAIATVRQKLQLVRPEELADIVISLIERCLKWRVKDRKKKKTVEERDADNIDGLLVLRDELLRASTPAERINAGTRLGDTAIHRQSGWHWRGNGRPGLKRIMEDDERIQYARRVAREGYSVAARELRPHRDSSARNPFSIILERHDDIVQVLTAVREAQTQQPGSHLLLS